MDTVESFPRRILKLCFVIFIPLSMFLFISAMPTKYEVYYDGSFIGYVNSKNDLKLSEKNIVNRLNSRFNGNIKLNGNAIFKKASDDIHSVTSKDQLEKNIINKIDFKVNACRVTIDGQKLGYLANKNEGEELLNKVSSVYISKLGLQNSSIENIEKKSNIKLEDEETLLKYITTPAELSKTIFDHNKKSKNKLVSIIIKTEVKEEKEIEPPIVYKNTDNLFIGEKKTENGSNGKKEVLKRYIYENEKIIESNVIDEKVLNEPRASIVYRGTKNPISEGVRFLDLPSRGSISSPYGERGGKIHHGIDIASNTGTPIVAASDGVVSDVSYDNIYGNKIVLNHGNNIQTLYGHCSEFLCKKGDIIQKGQTIGRVGSTGNSTGPHLHFELRNYGKAINPNIYIK